MARAQSSDQLLDAVRDAVTAAEEASDENRQAQTDASAAALRAEATQSALIGAYATMTDAVKAWLEGQTPQDGGQQPAPPAAASHGSPRK